MYISVSSTYPAGPMWLKKVGFKAGNGCRISCNGRRQPIYLQVDTPPPPETHRSFPCSPTLNANPELASGPSFLSPLRCASSRGGVSALAGGSRDAMGWDRHLVSTDLVPGAGLGASTHSRTNALMLYCLSRVQRKCPSPDVLLQEQSVLMEPGLDWTGCLPGGQSHTVPEGAAGSPFHFLMAMRRPPKHSISMKFLQVCNKPFLCPCSDLICFHPDEPRRLDLTTIITRLQTTKLRYQEIKECVQGSKLVSG